MCIRIEAARGQGVAGTRQEWECEETPCEVHRRRGRQKSGQPLAETHDVRRDVAAGVAGIHAVEQPAAEPAGQPRHVPPRDALD